MRTSFRKPVSHATLLNHYEWASARNHGRQMRKVREENVALRLAVKIQQALRCVWILFPLLAVGQPMPPNVLGKQSPYITTIDVRVTNTVTTVYEVSFLRTIRVYADATNTYYKTNFIHLDTVPVSVVTNITPVTLQ